MIDLRKSASDCSFPFRIDEDHLRDEVQLAQRRRRVFGLKDMVLQQEGDVVEKFNGYLAINPQDGAVDEDLFA